MCNAAAWLNSPLSISRSLKWFFSKLLLASIPKFQLTLCPPPRQHTLLKSVFLFWLFNLENRDFFFFFFPAAWWIGLGGIQTILLFWLCLIGNANFFFWERRQRWRGRKEATLFWINLAKEEMVAISHSWKYILGANGTVWHCEWADSYFFLANLQAILEGSLLGVFLFALQCWELKVIVSLSSH